MSTMVEKIKDIEKEIARTQVNKATMSHLCQLRARLAKLRTQLLEPPKGSAGAGDGFEVEKAGDARVALIGFPSVGKSTILNTFTSTKSEAASYEFTTLTCIPGVINYRDCRIQLLDLPGIIEGASEGKGRGRQAIGPAARLPWPLSHVTAARPGLALPSEPVMCDLQVIGVAKSADLILLVVDAGSGKADRQRELLEAELEAVGLRLNKARSPVAIVYGISHEPAACRPRRPCARRPHHPLALRVAASAERVLQAEGDRRRAHLVHV